MPVTRNQCRYGVPLTLPSELTKLIRSPRTGCAATSAPLIVFVAWPVDGGAFD